MKLQSGICCYDGYEWFESFSANKEHCSILYSIKYLFVFVINCISVNPRFKRGSQMLIDDLEFIDSNVFSFFSLFLLKSSLFESVVSAKYYIDKRDRKEIATLVKTTKLLADEIGMCFTTENILVLKRTKEWLCKGSVLITILDF